MTSLSMLMSTTLPPLPPRVDVREVGLRDGLQLEETISLSGKLALIDALVAAGLRRIEATSFVSPRAVPALADAALVAEALPRWPEVRWSALVASVKGARRALDSGVVHLEYVVSAADGHSWANTGRTTVESVALVTPITELVHQAGGTCEVVMATAWDCPLDGRVPLARAVEVAAAAVEAGADRLSLGDTIGTTTPRRVVELLTAVREVCPVPVGAHFHNTRGAGLACVLAALQAGVTELDASVGGLGGCPFAPGASGNIATEELVYLLEECGVDTGVDLDALLDAAHLAQDLLGHPLDSNLLRAVR